MKLSCLKSIAASKTQLIALQIQNQQLKYILNNKIKKYTLNIIIYYIFTKNSVQFIDAYLCKCFDEWSALHCKRGERDERGESKEKPVTLKSVVHAINSFL